MKIKKGDKLPDAKVFILDKDPKEMSIKQIIGEEKVILFGLPGAFTPTCSAQHLPGYVEMSDALKEKGVDAVACMAVNDVFVMSAWGEAAGAGGKVVMLADGNAEYARALGLELDASGFGMGTRGQRFSIIVDDGVVTELNIEAPGEFKVSSAEVALEQVAAEK